MLKKSEGLEYLVAKHGMGALQGALVMEGGKEADFRAAMRLQARRATDANQNIHCHRRLMNVRIPSSFPLRLHAFSPSDGGGPARARACPPTFGFIR
ncbi:TPA: hypothetical protein QDC03_003294 [Burkholderia cepacia]|uniref:hypothetical protein n=1 Tax=Burkholderia TaxID=32008 RepID=UPI0011B26529|nr:MULTISPECIES: hypothetical protein [Burkholderia]HDR9508195.1 hypothetical protein [Burkholderia cepacia]